MVNKLVSVIIPIYNVENYLSECLDSVRRQTLKNIEIICVDDGSTDKSPQIIKRYQKKDNRIKCITKANSGYGNTMNVGFDAATGEYVLIAESDDYIEPNTCEVLYNKAKEYDLDIVKSDYYTFSSGDKKQTYITTCFDGTFYNKIIGYEKDPKIFDFRMNTWTALYRREFIEKNNIRHNETPGASYQDNGFWFQTIALAERLMYINKAFYHYRQDNPNSSINSKGKIYCMCDEYDYIYNFLNKREDIKTSYFVPFLRKRFYNCMTTYGRVSDENKLLFLERFSSDLKKLISENNFKLSTLNDPWIQSMISRIIDDYELFMFEDMEFRYNNERNQIAEKLDTLRKSNEIRKGLKIKSLFKK